MPRHTPSSPATAPQGATDSVFFGIVQGLEAQTLVPGQRLVEADLAVQFGVGRNSVREALQRLAAEGIVELSRHKGAAIRSLSLQDTMDVLDVAERITGLLARSAARGAASPQAAVPKAALAAALEELAGAAASGDPAAFGAARRHFYRALLELSGNRELRRLFPAIQMPIVHAQHRLASLQKLRLDDYRRIGKAVLGGQEAAADEAGMAHVQHVRQEILQRHAVAAGAAAAVRTAA
ncbi:GntR family transcriptional regulator [Aquincola sp. MAHUQ-54]|uniref:GntR family transcriptional regulator n=1 Tax=Aquincola agrisoli TaxID=3119538 RepID=A0AAW9QK10_9BURK